MKYQLKHEVIVKNTLKKHGFTLVEIMVTAAILGIVMAAFISFLNSSMKAQKNVQNAVDFDILKTSINLVLNTRACDGSFQTNSGNPIQITYPVAVSLGTNVISPTTPLPVSKIVQGSSVIADMSNPNLGGGMTLSKLEFTDAVYDGNQIIGPTTYRAFASVLKVEVKKATGSYGAQTYSKTFGVRILANSTVPSTTTGNVEKCDNTPIPPGTLCGDIFFSDNGVGTPCANIQHHSDCQGQTLSVPTNACMSGNPCPNVTNCPSGYSPKPLAYSWGYNGDWATKFQYYQCTCVKQ